MNKTVNYYDVLGVLPESTEKQILKAYRKKALICHPDKNPDNPKAAELFHELSDALKILTDPEAKAAFDKVLRAKEKAKLRNKALDAKRKKFKEDLEKREYAAQNEKEVDINAAERLAAEIKRLREEGSRLVKEQQDLVQKQLDDDLKKQQQILHDITPKLKVKWKADKKDHHNAGYNDKVLRDIFQKFGIVTAVVVSAKKNGLAIIEYKSPLHANMALEFAKGREENPLTISWLEAPPQTNHQSSSPQEQTFNEGEEDPACQEQQQQHLLHEQNFEELVLKKMRQAEERKRLETQIRNDDETCIGEEEKT